MATTYSWRINQLDTAPSKDGLTDVVVTVHWSRLATDGTHNVSSYGTMACGEPSETDFTAYPDLTQLQVESWLEAGLDVTVLDASLDNQIEMLINPPIVNLPLPWSPTGSIE